MPTESVLLENKRECFDGMRAYHQSEISHANHAITMLLSIAAAMGAIVVAILFPERPPTHVHEIVWGLFVTVVVLAGTIGGTAHIKISADHDVYASFGAEYVRTCTLLGLYAKDPADSERGAVVVPTAIKICGTIGQGKGYRKTQGIIWAFAGALAGITLFFAIVISRAAPFSSSLT